MRCRPKRSWSESNYLLRRVDEASENLADKTSFYEFASNDRRRFAEAARGRPGWLSLDFPPVGYRLQHATHHDVRFLETAGSSLRELLFRTRSLLTAELSVRDRRRAHNLAKRLLDAMDVGAIIPSPANPLFLRLSRIRITGAVWRLHDELDHLPRSVFTLIPRGLSLTEEELELFDPAREIEALRAALKRAGSSQASGCLILFLHAEWDATRGRYQIHFHGWAAGDMIEVVNALRKQRRFAKKGKLVDIDGVRTRVRIGRKPITNVPYRLSYNSLQPFWPARPSGNWATPSAGDDGYYRTRRRRRIPEPQHARHLLWLDRWTIEKISLRIGVSVIGGQLQLNRSPVSSNNRSC